STRKWRSSASGSCPMKRLSCPSKPSMRSPEPTPMSPVSVVTRTRVASKCTRGLVSQLALKAGASGRRWGLMTTAAVLCPGADGGLGGGALMPAARQGVGHRAFHSRAAPHSREIHYPHRKKALEPRGALAPRLALGEDGAASAQTACVLLKGWGLGPGAHY